MKDIIIYILFALSPFLVGFVFCYFMSSAGDNIPRTDSDLKFLDLMKGEDKKRFTSKKEASGLSKLIKSWWI